MDDQEKTSPGPILLLPLALVGVLWWLSNRNRNKKLERIIALPEADFGKESPKENEEQPKIDPPWIAYDPKKKIHPKKESKLRDGRGSYAKKAVREKTGRFLKKDWVPDGKQSHELARV